jgi:hypothetical protein
VQLQLGSRAAPTCTAACMSQHEQLGTRRQKYIEEQLAKRLGKQVDGEAAQPSGAAGQPDDEAAATLRVS